MREQIEMRGQLTLRLTDQTGQVVREQQYRNRIVISGRMLVAQMFGGNPAGTLPTPVTHMAVGTGAADPADDDADLKSPRSIRKPIAAPQYISFEETTDKGKVKRVRVSLTAVFDYNEANGGEPLREAGIFTAETGGVMYNRVVFDPVTKTKAFKLTLLWDIIF